MILLYLIFKNVKSWKICAKYWIEKCKIIRYSGRWNICLNNFL